jgi:hypothetical protein
VSADDISADHVADVNRRRRRDPSVCEGGMEDRGVWFRGAYERRVDDSGNHRTSPGRGLADTSVTKVFRCVPVGVSHNKHRDPGSTQGVNRPQRVRRWFAPQDLARAAAISELSQGADRILHPPRRHAQFIAQRGQVTDPSAVGDAAIKLPNRPVMSISHIVLVASDADPFQGVMNEIAARKHDHSSGIKEDRAAAKPA